MVTIDVQTNLLCEKIVTKTILKKEGGKAYVSQIPYILAAIDEHILSYKLQRTCNLIVKIELWCWFPSKNIWPKDGAHAHIWAYVFWQ